MRQRHWYSAWRRIALIACLAAAPGLLGAQPAAAKYPILSTVSGASSGGYQMGFQANTTQLWSVGDAGWSNTELGMMPGTSAAIAGLAGGGYQIAFQANTSELWTIGDAGWVNTHLGMAPGTSPAIAATPSGGYKIAFQANTTTLWTVSPSEGGVDYGLGMAAGTSPAIAGLAGGGYQIAFQANTTQLWTVGDAGWSNTELGMAAGTSPAIAGLTGGGYQIAFQANTTQLWTIGSAGWSNTELGMAAQTSPAIARLTGGGYQIAFQANTTQLWTIGSAGWSNTELGMASQTSPTIAALIPPNGCGAGRQLPSCFGFSDAGAQFIASFEGFVDHPYNDAAGDCTIGYGHRISDNTCTNDDYAQWGTITEAQGRELLKQDAERFAANIRAVLPNTPLYQHEFDALVSFSFNIGNGGFNGSSVKSDLSANPPNYAAVPDHMLLWVSAGGRKLCGLYRRRVSEGNLFSNGVYERLNPPCPPGYS